jgi:hypothetical protein
MEQDANAVPVVHRRRSRSKLKRLRKRVARLVNWRLLGIAVLTILTVIIVGGLVLATDSANRMNSSIANLDRILSNLQSRSGTELTLQDFERLQSSVDDLTNTLAIVRAQTAIIAPLAPLNSDLNASLRALDIAESLSLAVQSILTSVEPTIFFLVAGEEEQTVVRQISAGERIVERLLLGRSGFLAARTRLEQVKQGLDQINLTGVSPTLLLNTIALQRYYERFLAINESLLLAPDVLQAAFGIDSEQSYLILSANSDELRPSGGYISTYGWLTVRNGRITDYDYAATTAASPNPPSIPTPYVVPSWWIEYGQPIYAAWDGSWYADFQRTAEMAAWYYNNGNNPKSPVAGVLGVDIYAVESLLPVIGDVPIPDFDVVVTEANFRELVYDIRAFGGDELAHKRFVASLYREIFARWQTLNQDQERSAQLLGVLLQALQRKHMMFYFTDARLNQMMDYLGWSGRQIPAVNQDYLMVADANLGNKSNRSIIRQLTYDVQIEPDDRLESRVTVAYDYPRSLASADPAVDEQYHGPLDYSNLLQVFVPAASTVTAVQGTTFNVNAVAEDTQTILITQLQVPFDGGARVQFAYRSAPAVVALGDYRRYRLILQKQPGMEAELVTVQVSLPATATLLTTFPSASASYSLDRPIVEFRVELVADTAIEVIYRP